MAIAHTGASKRRSFAKALSWRVFGSVVTMGIGFLLTHQLLFSLSIGVLEFFSKIALYYLHERLWEGVFKWKLQ